MPDQNKYARMDDVTREECFERWDGVDWKSNEDGTDRGICKSDHDFDGWAAQHEAKEGEEDE